jgi:serine/threonine protein kinase
MKLNIDLKSKVDYEPKRQLSSKSKFKPSLDLTSFKSTRRYSEEVEKEKVDKLFEKLKSIAPEGDVYDKYMKIEKKLASGMYGVVGFYYKKDSSTDKMYIVKAISYKRGHDVSYDNSSIKIEVYNKLINEILSLKEVQENNCKETNLVDLCFIEAFRDDENIYIVTQFKNDTTSLQKFIEENTFSIKQIVTYILILLNKLKTIHSLNIAHNDVKPANILVQYDNNGIIDLSYIDYGESCLCNNSDICTTSGSVYYHPENVLYTTKQKCNLTYYNDIYSLGIITRELLKKSKIKNDILERFVDEHMLNEDMYDTTYTIGYLNDLINKFSLILNKIINETSKADDMVTLSTTSS